jgi:hypothetical protein
MSLSIGFRVAWGLVKMGARALLGLRKGRGMGASTNPLTIWEATKSGSGLGVVLGWLAAAIGLVALYLSGYLPPDQAIIAGSTLIAGIPIVIAALRFRMAQGKTLAGNRELLEATLDEIFRAADGKNRKDLPTPAEAIDRALAKMRAAK